MAHFKNVTSPYERQPYVHKVCADPLCGQAFPTQVKRQRYCSHACQDRVAALRYYWRHRDARLASRERRRRALGVPAAPRMSHRHPCPYPDLMEASR